VSAVAAQYDAFQKLGVEVFSVSVDSHFVHKMWNDNELVKMIDGGVKFHMLADQAGSIGRAYGVWDENQGIEMRGRFIIDPDGGIQAMEVLARRRRRCARSRLTNWYVLPAARKPRRLAGNRARKRSSPGPNSSATSGKCGTRRWNKRCVFSVLQRPCPSGGASFFPER
jgi:hypothetical protein